MNYETQYLTLCQKILNEGEYTQDRTGTGTYSVFGEMMKHDLSKGFPLLTTKKINFNLIVGELLWMLSGSTDLPSLRKYQDKPKNSHTIWSDDFEKFWDKTPINTERHIQEQTGGNIYGKQLRSYSHGLGDTHDQLTTLIKNIRVVAENPEHAMGRRLRCTFWHPFDHVVGDKNVCALPACHTDFQCLVRNGKLHLSYSMRSNDMFLGQPFNTGFYATLCHILAKLAGLEVGDLVYFGNDVHIYSNHVEQVKTQLSRIPKELPTLMMPEFETLEELLTLTGKDFKLRDYNPHGFIKAPQAS